MMQREAERERDSRFNDYDTLSPAAGRPAPPPTSPQTPQPPPPPPAPIDPPKPSRRDKAIRSSHLLAAAGAVALAFIGIVIWSIDWASLNTTGSTSADPAAQAPVYNGPSFHGKPLVESAMLGYTPWEQPNRPFRSVPQEDPDVYVADDDLVPAGAGVIEYVGRVISDRPGVILSGELVISLVNPQGTEKARTTTPIALVSPDQSMLLHVPIPANLDPTTLHPTWSITVGRVIETDEFIENLAMRTESVGADTMARITIGNDSDVPWERITLVITAWGDQAQPLRRWQVEWPIPLKPTEVVEFFTRTPVNPTWDIREWTVAAVAN
ncbi:MAG: hypothetical protein R3C45_11305 [Phycisphaerales bacterium]